MAARQAEVIAEVGLDLDVKRAFVGRDWRGRRSDVRLLFVILVVILLELNLGAVGLDVLALLLLSLGLCFGLGLAGNRGDGRELVALFVFVLVE